MLWHVVWITLFAAYQLDKAMYWLSFVAWGCEVVATFKNVVDPFLSTTTRDF